MQLVTGIKPNVYRGVLIKSYHLKLNKLNFFSFIWSGRWDAKASEPGRAILDEQSGWKYIHYRLNLGHKGKADRSLYPLVVP